MNAVIIFCALSLLLIVGKLLRVAIPVFQKLYLPSSVIGGTVGLILCSCFSNHIPPEIIGGIKKLPGFLINVVFAAL